MKLRCHLPECILGFEHIAVALSSLVATEANVVGLAYWSTMSYLLKSYSPYHEVIAILQCDCAIEVREEDEFWVLERLVHGLKVRHWCGHHLDNQIRCIR